MKTFDVYKHPTQGYQIVKQGFGWPALFFTVIWAFVKKMWGLGFVSLGVIFLLTLVETVFEQKGSQVGVLVMLLAQLAFYIVVGVNGNGWRRENLVKRGFEKLNTVEAETPDAAIASSEITKSYKKPSQPNGDNEILNDGLICQDVEVDDTELYLKATNEVEGVNRDPALWAKMMALNGGDSEKAKYQYINTRVELETARKILAKDRLINSKKNSIETQEELEKKIPANAQIKQENLVISEEDKRLFYEAKRVTRQLGDAGNQTKLAAMYEHGKGTMANLDKAIELYRKAAAQGHSKAGERLMLLEKNETAKLTQQVGV